MTLDLEANKVEVKVLTSLASVTGITAAKPWLSKMGLAKEQVRCNAIKLNNIRSARRAEVAEYQALGMQRRWRDLSQSVWLRSVLAHSLD
jgi:hypothetical protein